MDIHELTAERSFHLKALPIKSLARDDDEAFSHSNYMIANWIDI